MPDTAGPRAGAPWRVGAQSCRAPLNIGPPKTKDGSLGHFSEDADPLGKGWLRGVPAAAWGHGRGARGERSAPFSEPVFTHPLSLWGMSLLLSGIPSPYTDYVVVYSPASLLDRH